ncbi:MAG: c-type cytochrome biogenesis protein CcmI, partial [Pseudomonadota bacterium]
MALFWVGGTLTLLTVGILLRPLWQRDLATASFAENHEVSLYRDQLEEVSRDLARDAITPDQATAARQEIERRLLLAARRNGDRNGYRQASRSRFGRLTLALIIAAMPLMAGSLYMHLGSPPKKEQATAPSSA